MDADPEIERISESGHQFRANLTVLTVRVDGSAIVLRRSLDDDLSYCPRAEARSVGGSGDTLDCRWRQCLNQFRNRGAEDRVPPGGRNIAQGAQHKQPCMHPGVGKLGRTPFYPSIIIDEIEIKSPRGIEGPTPAAKLYLNFVQRGEQWRGIEVGSNRGDRIDEGWIGGIWPCGGSVETRSLFNRYLTLRQP